MFIIDSQIHLWTATTAPPHHRQAPYLAADALAAMDAAGVARAINCPAIWDADANDYAVRCATAHPTRLATLGWFPIDTQQDDAFVHAFLDRPGMLGLRFVVMQPEVIRALGDGGLDWLWRIANDRAIPVALILPKPILPAVGPLADRFPRIRFMLDHLNVGPFEKLPGAMDHIDTLVALAAHPNIAMKASATPSMSNEAYPFRDVSPHLERIFRAYGAQRMFWGTDMTRMQITLPECIAMFTDHLPWLRGGDLDAVMGLAVRDWVGWPM